MNARILRPEELLELDIPSLPPMPTNEVQVVGVEHEGKIVACASIFRATHWEGTWISPEHRNGGVVRALLQGATDAALAHGSPWVFTGSDGKQMDRILKRLGGVPVEMQSYILPLEGVACRKSTGLVDTPATLATDPMVAPGRSHSATSRPEEACQQQHT